MQTLGGPNRIFPLCAPVRRNNRKNGHHDASRRCVWFCCLRCIRWECVWVVLTALPAPVASSSTPPPPPPVAPNTFGIPTECIPSASDFQVPMQKCTRCPFTGPITSFPTRRAGPGHLKVCTACMDKQNARKVASEMVAEASNRGQIATAAMSLEDFLKLVALNKTRPFDFDTMINIPPGMFVAGEHLYNRSNRIRDYLAEASDYHWKYVLPTPASDHEITVRTAKRKPNAVERRPSSLIFAHS